MIEGSADFLRLYMVLSAAFGFLAGDAFGDRRHRKCLEQINDDLEDRLEKARAFEEPATPGTQASARHINDIHKQLTTVTKALQKHPS